MKKCLLKNLILSSMIFLIVFSLFPVQAAAEGGLVGISVDVTFHQTEARETLGLVNDFRTGEDAWYWNSGNETKTEFTDLPELIYDYALEEGAMKRAAETAVMFSHTRPNGETCYSAYEELGYVIYSGGENIAYGYRTPESVIDTWREDGQYYSGQGHRRNMLNPKALYYACGCVEYGGRLYWVQIFSRDGYRTKETPANDSPSTETVSVLEDYIDSWRFTPSVYTLTAGEEVSLRDLGTVSGRIASGRTYFQTDLVPEWTSDSENIRIEEGTVKALSAGQAILTDEERGLTHVLAILRGSATVVRLSGKTRYETSLQIAEELKNVLHVDRFDTVLLATGENFADALGGGYLAAGKNAPILLTKPGKQKEINAYIKDNLKEDGTVYVLGGEGAVPPECLEGLEGYTVTRLSGKTRYETNIEILREAGVSSEDILIATGENYADSLSASSAGKPVLLVNTKKNVLSEAQKSFLEAYKENAFYILGGTGAVSQEIEDEIALIRVPERIRGVSRQETSVEVASAFFENAEKAVLAYSDDFPDGLCAGPLAHALNAPILLVKSGREAPAMVYMAQKGIVEGYVTGGTGRIPDDSVRLIFYLTDENRIVTRDQTYRKPF